MNIKIKTFTGPLDLLWQLIRQNELDIFDIDIHKITEQYLMFIKENDILDLNSAGDFIKIAAVLIYIKSKSLFPSDNSEDSDIDNSEALKKEIIQNLLKMQSVQTLSQKFNNRYLLNRDIWSAGGNSRTAILSLFPKDTNVGIKPQTMLPLMRAYKKMFHKKTQITRAALSLKKPLPLLADCIRSIYDRLIVGTSLTMSSLVYKKKDKLSHHLITFLSLLELSRLGVVSLTQTQDYADIDILVEKQFNRADFKFIKEVKGATTKEATV